jgi:hypothetical protein
LVGVINETLARHYFDGLDPIGQRVAWGTKRAKAEWMTIVGVVNDIHSLDLTSDEEAAIYLPYTQRARNASWKRWMSFVLRTESSPRASCRGQDCHSRARPGSGSAPATTLDALRSKTSRANASRPSAGRLRVDRRCCWPSSESTA